MIYPKYYFKDVTKISVEFLEEHNIKGLILDVDNTLIDINRNVLKGVKEWHDEIRKAGIKTIILSNTNKIDKVKGMAELLEIEYISFAHKPMKKGFFKAQKKLGLDSQNIASIGDQIFTDVIGANRCNMISILVEPVDKTKDLLITRWKRPLENVIKKRYLKDTNNFRKLED